MCLLYYPLRALLFLIGLMPVSFVARMGRFFGAIAYLIDKRHRKVSQDNLRLIFGNEWSEKKIKTTARENYLRIVESYFSAISTSQMSNEKALKYVTLHGTEKMRPQNDPEYGPSRIALIGHFGNFELYAKGASIYPWLQFATTFRGLDNKLGDKLLSALRAKSGCIFFERRRDGAALKKAMNSRSMLIGLLADQSPGDHGIWLPFMGIECRCSTSAAIFALRYNCPILPIFCYRKAPGRWEIIFDDEIPNKLNGELRSVRDITIDINKAYEVAIRRDPANWFWAHRRWKTHFKQMEELPKNNSSNTLVSADHD